MNLSSPAYKRLAPRRTQSRQPSERQASRVGAALRWLRKPWVLDTAIGALAIILIASPLLFTNDAFAPDFTDALWMANVQEHAIAANLHPTIFLQTTGIGVFEPLFIFYGGTLYSLTGALGAILGGSTILAFEIVTLIAIVAAYGGVFWLTRQLGVRGLLSHAPAIVFVTSAYYVTNLYGRGAWTEFVAVSALPPVIAAGLRIVRGPLRAAPAACLVAATAIFSGSHNITLLLGTTVVALALAIFWLMSGLPRQLPWRGMLTAAGLIALGGALNAWALLPDISYAHDTAINAHEISWISTKGFNTAGVIFDPLRMVPSESTSPALYVQAPVFALIWGLIALPLVWKYRRLRAAAVTALVVLCGLLAAIMSSHVYALLPSLYRNMEFAYRMQTYVTLACVGLVLLGTLALTRRARSGHAEGVDRVMRIGLGLVVAFSLGIAVWQLWVPNTHIEGLSYEERGQALAGSVDTLPGSWYASDDYGDHSLPLLSPRSGITLNPEGVTDEHLVQRGVAPSGPFATNIAGGPYLVHVSGGVHVVGRTSQNTLVVERNEKGSAPIRIELGAQLSRPVVMGRILTAIAAVLVLILAGFAAVRSRRRRRKA